MAKVEIKTIIRLLKKAYPSPECELDFTNAYEVLVATILSAQCTDKKVNTVTPTLFKKYPDPQILSRARLASVEKIIKSLGLYHNKAKSIISAAKCICSEFNGVVPETMDELTRLAGVGRKTANCVLVNAFNKPGIMVDTHCIRVSNRLGLVATKDAVKIELALKEIVPLKEQGAFSHRVILHGRRVCFARKPNCLECILGNVCPSCEVDNG